MDERVTGAYAAVKLCQQVLATVMDMKLPEEARSKVSDVMAELAHVRDGLVVLREELHRLEFDNAALRAELRHRAEVERPPEPRLLRPLDRVSERRSSRRRRRAGTPGVPNR